MPVTLEQIRGQWEMGLTPLSVMDRTKSDGCVLVILKNKSGKYQCHRYFGIMADWVCSVDGQDVSLEAVFSWLNAPSATSTRKLIVPTPVEETNE